MSGNKESSSEMDLLKENLAGLSDRGVENVALGTSWGALRKILAAPYDEVQNPTGIINLGLAENFLMHKEIADRLKITFDVDLPTHLTYGQGPVGSPRLLKALASFFNSRFSPVRPFAEQEILVGSGVAALIDSSTWCICDADEGILVPRPLYVGFDIDISMRSRGKMLPVSFMEPDQPYSIDRVFSPDANFRAFERAFTHYTEEGIPVRTVLISNPHNPLGKCYSLETVVEIARFCAQHDLHIICDEIYANSVFNEPAAPDFTSALSINLDAIISPSKVHVLYGMSKDFCANGMRLGVLQTRNEDLLEAVASINLFSWPAYLTQDLWAGVLEDAPFVDWFVKENHYRMAASYKSFTSSLKRHNIPCLEGSNSGFYLWVRLVPSHLPESAVSSAKKALVERCLRNGASIKDGSHYFAEEPEDGWFRITFTVPGAVLQVALERLVRSLGEFGWFGMDC